MTYTVVWRQYAEDALADLWVRHKLFRQAIRQAADQIDPMLRTLPDQKGVPHTTHRRLLYLPPLAVIYRVLPADRKVRVLDVIFIPPALGNGQP
jgi:hypothetical protein